MYSVKPGRGPSLLGAIMGLVIGVPFVIFWISQASSMGAPGFFVFFGIAFLVVVIVQSMIGIYNATSRNRISEYDITTGKEEGDPFDKLVTGSAPANKSRATAAQRFCPYCGEALNDDFSYCPKCGKPTAEVGGKT